MPNFLDIDSISIAAVAVAALLSALLFQRGHQRGKLPGGGDEDRLDTLLGWPPERVQVLRRSEKAAFATVKRAFPEHMILAQVPVARFITVPKKSSHGEWMRRLGGQCVDLAICDQTSQVLAVVMVRPPESAIAALLRKRLDRVARSLEAAGVPLCVWSEEALPSMEDARRSIAPLLRARLAAAASVPSAKARVA